MTFRSNTIKFDCLKFISILFYFIPVSLGYSHVISDILLSIIASSFILFIIINKKWDLLKNKFTYLFFLFWTIIVINSFFAEIFIVAFRLSFFYIRYLFFSLAVYFLIKNNKNFLSNSFYSVSFAYIVVLLFSYFQLITGYNIILDNLFDLFDKGFKPYPQRISGLFGKELVLGGYLIRMFPLYLALYFIQKKNLIINISFYSISILVIIMNFFAGERSSLFLLAIILTLAIFLIKDFLKLKKYLLIFISVAIILITGTENEIKRRFFIQTFFMQIYDNNKLYFFSEQHEAHFKTAYNIFKDNMIFGSGAKMFSVKCHDAKYNKDIPIITYADGNKLYLSCTTHPHNTYLQILAETGLVGFFF